MPVPEQTSTVTLGMQLFTPFVGQEISANGAAQRDVITSSGAGDEPCAWRRSGPTVVSELGRQTLQTSG